MFDITAKYIALCSKLCAGPSDYTKANVKAHNNASRELLSCAEELSKNPALAESVFSTLMQHENAKVRQTAATHALKYHFCTEQALETLDALSMGEDPFASWEADLTRKVWRGEVSGKQL